MPTKTAISMPSQCPDSHSFYEKNEFILECKNCGLGKTRTKTTLYSDDNYDAEIDKINQMKRKLYQGIYDKYLAGIFKKNTRVLEVGCGQGLFLELLKSRGWEVYGVEPYPHQHDSNITVWQARIEDFSSELKFDLIIMFHSLEHTADCLKALAKCRELLKDDGKIYISVPNYAGWWSRITGMNWTWLDIKEHNYHYTIESLRKILSYAGFKIGSLETHTSALLFFAPSLANVYLSEKRFFDKFPFSVWPLNALLFRFSNYLRRPLNFIADLSLNGAEIQIVAEKNREFVQSDRLGTGS